MRYTERCRYCQVPLRTIEEKNDWGCTRQLHIRKGSGIRAEFTFSFRGDEHVKHADVVCGGIGLTMVVRISENQ